MKRYKLRKLANKKHRDPFDTTIHEQYHDTLTQYKKLLNSRKNDSNKAKISELDSDANFFWQSLKSMDDTWKGEDVPSISGKKIGCCVDHATDLVWSSYYSHL